MAELRFFRWHNHQKSAATFHRWSRPQIPSTLRCGALYFLLPFSLLCSLLIARTSAVIAQSLPETPSEVIFKRLEGRRPPVPEFTPAPEGQIVGMLPPPQATSSSDPQAQLPQSTIPSLLAPPPKPVKFVPAKIYVGKIPLRTAAMLNRFYEGRGHQPAWTHSAGVLPHAGLFLQLLREEAAREGLQADGYNLATIATLIADFRSETGAQKPIAVDTLIDLEFLLSEAFFRYGADASLGDVNLDALNEKWFEKNGEADLVLALQDALLTDTLEATLKSFPPQQEKYRKLQAVFTQYRTIAAQGGWPTVPAGVLWQFGDRGEGVAKLQARLRASGDLGAASPSTSTSAHLVSSKQKSSSSIGKEEAFFDEATEQAVENFQRRHGLAVTGVVNKETLSALNVSADIRTRQIARNLERWRRLPKDLGRRHIAVNVPDFMLEVVENDLPIMDMKVVVGKIMQQRTTPTFSALMKYVVLNPYWNVPKNIAEKELLPLSRKNPAYFARNKFTLRRIPVGVKQVPDPNATDGSLIPVRTYEYALRQGPGPKNALGRVKFMFPNDHSVYLHDTPSKDLFNRTIRAFSHGCIRIEKPLDLAEYLLQGTPKGSREAILATFKHNKEQTVWLPEPVPVHIQYWTAWIADDGTLQFRNDIYGYDRLPGTRPLPIKETAKPRPKIRKKPQPQLQIQQDQPRFDMQPQPEPPPPAQTEAHSTM